MAATIDLAESAVFTALRSFILDVTPIAANNVRQGQINRVAMPVGNCAIMSITRRMQLATTARTYRPSGEPAPAPGHRDTQRSTEIDIQVDFYGAASGENVQIFTTLFRDLYGCDFMRTSRVQPLYCSDPRQMPLVTGEDQYEERWTTIASLQFNPTVSTSQQFADIVEVGILEADQHGS